MKVLTYLRNTSLLIRILSIGGLLIVVSSIGVQAILTNKPSISPSASDSNPSDQDKFRPAKPLRIPAADLALQPEKDDPVTKSASFYYSIQTPVVNPVQDPIPAVIPTLLPVGRYRNLVFTDIDAQRDIVFKSTYLTKASADEFDQYTLEDDLDSPTNLKLNIYQPANDNLTKRPLIILAYGGGWTYGDRNQREDEAIDFAKMGYVAMTMDYTMVPPNLASNPPSDDQLLFYGPLVTKGVDDIYDAYKYIYDNSDEYGVDQTRIGIGGWSVGGLMITALTNVNMTATPFGIRAALPASSIFPTEVGSGYGGWRTFDSNYNPKNLFVSFADDDAQNGPYSPETDCATLDALGHTCSSILAPGNFHEIFFNLPPLRDPAIDFFATNVAGY